VEIWDLMAIDMPGGTLSPVVLRSADDARAVLVGLEPGQALGDHGVKENAWLVVVDGAVEVEADGTATSCGAGTLVSFTPDERHAVRSAGGARVLMLLAPWPGEGHYRGGG